MAVADVVASAPLVVNACSCRKSSSLTPRVAEESEEAAAAMAAVDAAAADAAAALEAALPPLR